MNKNKGEVMFKLMKL